MKAEGIEVEEGKFQQFYLLKTYQMKARVSNFLHKVQNLNIIIALKTGPGGKVSYSKESK